MYPRLFTAAASCFLLFGCTTPPEKSAEAAAGEEGWVEVTYRVISAPHTPLFRYGPAQATGPDVMLKKDALVELVKAERGFSRIRTEDSIEGYVANDRLAEAPPDRLPGAHGGMGLLPDFRTDTTSTPEWLEVGTVDEMLIQNPPGELLLPEESAESAPAPETTPQAAPSAAPEATPPAAAVEPTPSSTPTPTPNG